MKEIKPIGIETTDDACTGQPVRAIETETNLNFSSRPDNVKSWTNADVKNWVTRNHINEEIAKVLNQLNGEQLVHYNSIRLKAPEYFYKSLNAEILSVICFDCALENLFKN